MFINQQPISPAETSSFAHLRHTILRGGHMTKHKGHVASLAPTLGGLAIAMLTAAPLAVTGTAVDAGSCTESGMESGVWTCSGAADAMNDVEQDISAVSGDLTVTTTSDFGMNLVGDPASVDDFVIRVSNSGVGSVTFTDEHNASITSTGTGLSVSGFGADVTIETNGDILAGADGRGDGVQGLSLGAGMLRIVTEGSVSGTEGILANNFGTSSLVRTLGPVTGFGDDSVSANTGWGILSFQNGMGSQEIEALGDVKGRLAGIAGVNYGGESLTIDAINTQGGTVGIFASNMRGALTIRSAGLAHGGDFEFGVPGSSPALPGAVPAISGAFGIYAINRPGGTTLSITSNEAYGLTTGIHALNYGTGGLTISVSGDVTGGSGSGIEAYNSANDVTSSMVINQAMGTTTTGAIDGINANNAGGSLTINALGTAIGTANAGIDAINQATATDLSVTSNIAQGGNFGIRASNDSTGTITITSTMSATGTTLDGIRATNTTAGSTITISAVDVTGGRQGIRVDNRGTGASTVTATGLVTGNTAGGGGNNNAIFVRNNNAGTGSIIINAVDTLTTAGVGDGIRARHDGSGTIEIYSTGDATGARDGILAHSLLGADITVEAADATGTARAGVHTRNNGMAGATLITTTGAIMGGALAGIQTETSAGLLTTINVNSGSVAATSGVAISNNEGDSITNIAAGAVITGDVVLGDGSDAVNLAGGFTGITLLDGGDDYGTVDTFNDVLTLTDMTDSVAGAILTNWEEVHIGSGATVSFSDGMLTAGVGSEAATGLFVDAGGTLDAVGGFDLTGNLHNTGTITTQDGAVGDIVTVTFGDYTGGGDLLIDADLSYDGGADNTPGTDVGFTDQLIVAGTASGTTNVFVTDIGAGGAATDLNNNGTVDVGEGILFAQTVGGAADSFVLGTAPVVAGAYQFDVYSFDAGSTASGAWEYVLASAFTSTANVYEAAPFALLDGLDMPTLEQRVGQRRWSSAAGNASTVSGEWLRVYGDWGSSELASGTSYDSDSWGIQAGFDLPVERGDTGQWVLGMTAQTSQSSTAITSPTGTGSISAQTIGFGGTATWYGDTGLYVDLQSQVNWISADYNSSLDGVLAEDELARSVSTSAEIGKRFALNENAGLTPQAQLTWSQLDGGSFTDSAGNDVDLGTTERLTGRIGLAYDHEWQGDNGSSNNVYAIANILHDFDGSSVVQVAGTDITAERDATWAEIGLGGTISWGEGNSNLNTELYGEASYRQALDTSDSNALAATAGIRIQW